MRATSANRELELSRESLQEIEIEAYYYEATVAR